MSPQTTKISPNIPAPVLCFVHGLLGSGEDWQPLIDELQRKVPSIPCVTLDLPFHGKAQTIAIESFEQAADYLYQQLQGKVIHAFPHRAFWLVGYSLGGRLCLYFTLEYLEKFQRGDAVNKSLQKIILEGANFGLADETAKRMRWQNDQQWAARFATEPLAKVLDDWYQQPVFAHLTAAQRQALIQKRAKNNGKAIAKMLAVTSLAKQPFFATTAYYQTPAWQKLVYFYGKNDEKFRRSLLMLNACGIHLPQLGIDDAGHNVHQENPQQMAQFILQLIGEKNTRE